ncbi:putative F-box/LRR-repeat protein 9 [Cucurbita pepo subsp. pepo]|uniref:putative F-box/LRR-repeat protein 9 n=1 Tax=Cucurbita pepo subsp. pepo TaxID=3664 RepID=UPI000C9D66CE|nr:putative F-box/LRR-repeat protein 9 [Cucurbita pepo subsp. pepo]
MDSNPSSEEVARNWLESPADIMSMILLKLGAIDILSNLLNVCSSWRKIRKDDLEIICIDAVDVNLLISILSSSTPMTCSSISLGAQINLENSLFCVPLTSQVRESVAILPIFCEN